MQISKITRRSAIALSVAAALTLAGCGDKEPAKSELVPVGIVQLVEHSALDACTKGVKDALAERGYKDGVNIKIDFQNAQGDQSNLHNIATRFVSNKDKLIFAVATPAAQAVATTAKGTPIVATAITDFVAAKLVKSDEQPGGNVTGVSDLGPIEAQLELLLKLVPDAKAVGKVQGMWLPTDNVLASAIPALAKVANPSKIPVIAGERGMTEAGCLGSISVDYYEIGRMTGQMGADILDGKKKPAEMPVQHVANGTPVFNMKTAAAIGITIPDELKKGAVLFQ